MQAYQWPELTDDMDFSDAPAFIRKAIAEREIRISDGYATVYTPTDNVTAKLGDFIIGLSNGTMYVVPAPVYFALTGRAPLLADANNAQVEGADAPPDDEPAPPYSSAVLARSARAREAQADWLDQHPEQNQK
jgi:hypothetical protein